MWCRDQAGTENSTPMTKPAASSVTRSRMPLQTDAVMSACTEYGLPNPVTRR